MDLKIGNQVAFGYSEQAVRRLLADNEVRIRADERARVAVIVRDMIRPIPGLASDPIVAYKAGFEEARKAALSALQESKS